MTFSLLKLILLKHGFKSKEHSEFFNLFKFFWRSEGNGMSLQGSACRMGSYYHSLNKNNMKCLPTNNLISKIKR